MRYPNMKQTDYIYMKRAIDLAKRGQSNVSPNPMVGAVIVKDDRIIAEGWHEKYGEAHAERNAINSVADKSVLHGSTMYVTLEPCCHYGKTPPCADYIIENGISRVVVGAVDPNPKVCGGGVKKLADAGIEVETGCLKDECEFVCRFFLTVQNKKRPYVMLKWAQSSDGVMGVRRISSEKSNVWFTGEDARIEVHRMRAEYDAIMVGTNTVLEDNPSLTVRAVDGRNPVRITVDRRGILIPGLNIFNSESRTIVLTDREHPLSVAHRNSFRSNVEFVEIDFSSNVIQNILGELSLRRISSLMVEGGAKLLGLFISSGLYDEVNIFQVSRSSDEIFKNVDYSEKVNAPEFSNLFASNGACIPGYGIVRRHILP